MRTQDIIDKLTVVDENICAEAVGQVSLFVDASRYRVAKMRARTAAEQALEGFSAAKTLSIRARAAQNGEKPTEGHIKSRLQKHPQYKSLAAALSAAEAAEEFAKLLLEACRMRRDAIKIIADAQGYEAMKGASQVERTEAYRKLSNTARELTTRRRMARQE